MNIEQRIEALKTQAAKQPLTWNPKKGEYLVGVFKRYGHDAWQSCNHFVIEDDKGVQHRVAMSLARQAELTRNKAAVGDLLSIQYLGKEPFYRGGTVDVYNLIVDKG